MPIDPTTSQDRVREALEAADYLIGHYRTLWLKKGVVRDLDEASLAYERLRDAALATPSPTGWHDIASADRREPIIVGRWVWPDVGLRYWSSWIVAPGEPLGCDGERGDEPTHWHARPAPPTVPGTTPEPPAATVPAGWKLVPIASDRDMQDAATEVAIDDGRGGITALNWSEAEEVWSAMLAAAPTTADEREEGR